MRNDPEPKYTIKAFIMTYSLLLLILLAATATAAADDDGGDIAYADHVQGCCVHMASYVWQQQQ
jgi:hypothetical protein